MILIYLGNTQHLWIKPHASKYPQGQKKKKIKYQNLCDVPKAMLR